MIKASRAKAAREWAFNFIKRSGLPIRPDEKDGIDIVDFGLNRFEEESLESELRGVKRIYYSPAVLLHKISFAAPPLEAKLDPQITI
jgi:hypothetical protein